MSVLKYQMKCKDEECAKTYFVLVDPEELKAPNICPFCGNQAFEDDGSDDSEG